jgi:hypothetical protein
MHVADVPFACNCHGHIPEYLLLALQAAVLMLSHCEAQQDLMFGPAGNKLFSWSLAILWDSILAVPLACISWGLHAGAAQGCAWVPLGVVSATSTSWLSNYMSTHVTLTAPDPQALRCLPAHEDHL